MAYSLEYKNWTGEDVEVTFEIEDDPLQPGDSDDYACDGIGSIGRYKDTDGTLMLKIVAPNEVGYELVPYLDIRQRYTLLPYIPKSV